MKGGTVYYCEVAHCVSQMERIVGVVSHDTNESERGVV
jgi:hypothetical protein